MNKRILTHPELYEESDLKYALADKLFNYLIDYCRYVSCEYIS